MIRLLRPKSLQAAVAGCSMPDRPKRWSDAFLKSCGQSPSMRANEGGQASCCDLLYGGLAVVAIASRTVASSDTEIDLALRTSS